MKGLYPKMMLLLGSATLVIMVAILVVVYITESREIEQEGLKRAQMLEQMAFEALYASMSQGGGREGNQQVIARLQATNAFTRLRVIKGAPVIEQFGAEPGELPQDDLERQALAGQEIRQIQWMDGYRIVRHVMPLVVHAECQRCHHAPLGAINGVISVELSLKDYDQALFWKRNFLLLVVAAGLGILGGLIFFTLRCWVIRPLQAIQRGAAAISQGNLDHRLEIATADELETLAHEFNTMAERLQASYTSLEQKVSERTQELATVVQVAEAVNRSLDLQEILPAVLDHAMKLTGATAAQMLVVKDGRLYLRASKGVLSERSSSPDFVSGDGRGAQHAASPAGLCLCNIAAAEGRPCRVDDLRQVCVRDCCCVEEGFSSALAVPVRAEGQIVGVIHLASPRLGAFHAQHEALLMAVGQHVGLALQRAQLYERERSQRQQAETLRAAAATLNASLDLEVVLHTLLERLGQVLVIDAGLILLVEGDELRVAAVRGRPELGMERLLGYRLPQTANRDFWRVLQEKQALTFCQPGRQPPFAGGFRPIEEVDWCLVVPLLRGEEVIGLLALEQLGHCYDEIEEPRIAFAFAHHAAIAIENARLYAQVRELNRQLESRVEERTRELRAARDALAHQTEQLRQLLGRMLAVQEEERHRIAHDIHDGVAQLIMGALYEAQAAKVCLPERPEVALTKLQNAQEILKQVKNEMRRIIYDLHPAVLRTNGLVSALADYIAKYQESTNIQCTLDTAGPMLRLPLEQEQTIYRIVQEALNNVARHAHARHAQVRLEFSPDTFTLIVADDGCGFEREKVPGVGHDHLGLMNMEERARWLGGKLGIESQPGAGTRVILQVPYNGDARSEV